jgi:hypothetical protein
MQNKTLKFRAWDKLAKQFTYPDKGYQGQYVLTLNGQFQNLQNGSGGDEYIVQQWTGLKDAKGIDIYEGDYVRYVKEYSIEDKWEIIAPVVFSPFGYGFVLDYSRRHLLGDIKSGDYVPLLSSLVTDQKITYEVVGNIF